MVKIIIPGCQDKNRSLMETETTKTEMIASENLKLVYLNYTSLFFCLHVLWVHKWCHSLLSLTVQLIPFNNLWNDSLHPVFILLNTCLIHPLELLHEGHNNYSRWSRGDKMGKWLALKSSTEFGTLHEQNPDHHTQGLWWVIYPLDNTSRLSRIQLM